MKRFEMYGFEQFGDGVDLTFLCRTLGVLGFMSYMAGYTALQLRLIDGDGLMYSFSKVLGATLVLISLTADFNLSAALIQVSFLMIGCVGIALRLRDRRRHMRLDRAAKHDNGASPALYRELA